MQRLLTVILIFAHYSLSHAIEGEVIPPLKADAWIALSYNKIPPNKVSFGNDSLAINVSGSAGPFVYKLSEPQKIIGFTVKGKTVGLKKVETTAFDEDSILRFGLVATGKQTLTGPKKWLAANWVKKLFSLVPTGTGLDKIYFFNVTNRPELNGKSRSHPNSDLLSETVFAEHTSGGPFDFNKKLQKPIEAAAIWISIDGDDTQSKFETIISEIRLLTTP
jgi:hypothetical protein